jgi:hypothetical protein
MRYGQKHGAVTGVLRRGVDIVSRAPTSQIFSPLFTSIRETILCHQQSLGSLAAWSVFSIVSLISLR